MVQQTMLTITLHDQHTIYAMSILQAKTSLPKATTGQPWQAKNQLGNVRVGASMPSKSHSHLLNIATNYRAQN